MTSEPHQKKIKNSPFITLDSVTMRIGSQLIFKDTDWKIGSDQQWALIGPNGSGKSLLANAIMYSMPIFQGRILYYFGNSKDDSDKARSYFDRGEIVKISPQSHRNLARSNSYHQARWNSIESPGVSTVADILTGKSIERISPFQVDPMKTAEETYRKRRDDTVALLGIEYLLDRKILHLSNGEARKVLLARALMQRPKLLILDDPFCGLDNKSRAILRNAINDLFAAGKMRILLITARLDEIPPEITHVLRVVENRVVNKGQKDQVLQTGSADKIFGPKKTTTHQTEIEFPVPLQGPAEKCPVLVEMKDVSVTYGEVKVLKGLDWTIKQGENWAVLGPNGAGKTTLLSLILADNPQSYSNDIKIFGAKRGSGERIWDIKQKIGWVSPELHINYSRGTTCLNVVRSGFFDSVGLYQQVSEELTTVANQWMKALGIADLANRSFGSVSVGEQRLLLLARSLVKNPLLLILDEPCQGLDHNNRTRIADLLDRLCQKVSVNLIYVTHHFDEMPGVITHILKLQDGQILDTGC